MHDDRKLNATETRTKFPFVREICIKFAIELQKEHETERVEWKRREQRDERKTFIYDEKNIIKAYKQWKIIKSRRHASSRRV